MVCVGGPGLSSRAHHAVARARAPLSLAAQSLRSDPFTTHALLGLGTLLAWRWRFEIDLWPV